ncbi:MAG TPA: hypothetical protein QF753_23180 [Victivallales bacterium]|nr:hypothetical protein [Victivallales bacterium]
MENTVKHITLCLLEELNDILSKGELESDKDLEQIVYQCKLLIDRVE